MNRDSRLSQIEDMDFAVSKIIHKGMPVNEVKDLLRGQGTSEAYIETIISTIDKTYTGMRRIECSKPIRAISAVIDTVLMFVTLILAITLLDPEWSIWVLCFTFLYVFIAELIWSRTVGMFITGIIIVDANGSKPDVSAILVRAFASLIPFLSAEKLSETFTVTKKFLDKQNWSPILGNTEDII